MKVNLTLSFPLNVRKAISHRHGWPKPATHEQCEQFVRGLLNADIESVMADYHQANACENCGCHAHLPRRCDTCGCIWERQ